jgi:hypothetical protein
MPSSATTLLPGQDNSAPSGPVSGASDFVVSCGVRLSEFGVAEIPKPLVARSIRVGGTNSIVEYHSLIQWPEADGSRCRLSPRLMGMSP